MSTSHTADADHASPSIGAHHHEHNNAHVHLQISDEYCVLHFAIDVDGAVNARLVRSDGTDEPVLAIGLGPLVAWVAGPKDKTEIAFYMSVDRDVSGTWYMPDGNGGFAKGRERSRRKSKVETGWGDGNLEIYSAIAVDGSEYRGRLKVSPRPIMPVNEWQAVNMQWDLADGKFASFGLDHKGLLFTTYCLAEDKSLAYGVGVVNVANGNGAYLSSDQVRPVDVRLMPHNHD